MDIRTIFRQLAADLLVIAGSYILMYRLGIQADSWVQLFFSGIKCVAVYFILSIAAHYILFRDRLYFLFREAAEIFKKL